MQTANRLIAAVALAGLGASAPAGAWEPPPRHAVPFELALHLGQERSDLELDEQSFATEFRRLGIALVDTRYSLLQPGIQAGLLFDGGQDANPQAEAASMDGYYVGASLRGRLFEHRLLSFEARADYRYQELGGPSDTGVRLSWHELQGEVGAAVYLRPLGLRGGAYTRLIDGEESVRGPGQGRDVEAADASGVFAAVDYWSGPGGRISLRAEAGAREALQLDFARRF